MVESRSKEIDGRSYTVTQMPAMKALRMTHRLGKALGPAIGHLAVQDGQEVDIERIGKALEALFTAMSEDDLETITKELLNSATVIVDSKSLPVLAQFNTLMAGQIETVFKLLGFALEVNYGSFFDVAKGFIPGDLAANPSSSGELST